MSEIKPGHYYNFFGDEETFEPDASVCVAVICRRLIDFAPNTLPPSGAVAACSKCGEPVVFNPTGPHLDAPRVCMQCAGIEPA